MDKMFMRPMGRIPQFSQPLPAPTDPESQLMDCPGKKRTLLFQGVRSPMDTMFMRPMGRVASAASRPNLLKVGHQGAALPELHVLAG